MIERLALISCFTTHLLVTAAFSELNGTLSCTDCKDCGPVTGTIGKYLALPVNINYLELWEHDIISSDDFQDKKPIIDGKYTKLCFNEFEVMFLLFRVFKSNLSGLQLLPTSLSSIPVHRHSG